LARRLEQAVAPRLMHSNLLGVMVRLGPGSTLLGDPQTGLDDTTFADFVRASFPDREAAAIPGVAVTASDRFARRAQFGANAGHEAWLDWRARQLGRAYGELATALQAYSPGTVLAVVTPGLEGGSAETEARRADRAGEPPDRAWLAVGLDLKRWPDGPE